MPLFYQLGFGMTPIQSGLMITPQALGALFMKALAPKLLHRYGYRTVLSSNTIAVGIILCLFGLITPNTSIWAMIPLMLLLGLCASLQFTSMNTLSYADLPNKDASMGTSISSTGQQLSNSFGVALAAVIVGLFLPEAYTLHSPEVFNAFNKSFVALGILTIISDLGFHALRKDDGSKIR
jgi:MFS family permease